MQGVFFRASARDEAVRLGLTGYARNLSDGTVEVVACGEDVALAQFERWLGRGPALARVSSVTRAAADIAAPSRFSID